MILILFSKIKHKGTSLFPFFLSVHASGEASAGSGAMHVGTRARCNGNAGRRECERAKVDDSSHILMSWNQT